MTPGLGRVVDLSDNEALLELARSSNVSKPRNLVAELTAPSAGGEAVAETVPCPYMDGRMRVARSSRGECPVESLHQSLSVDVDQIGYCYLDLGSVLTVRREITAEHTAHQNTKLASQGLWPGCCSRLSTVKGLAPDFSLVSCPPDLMELDSSSQEFDASPQPNTSNLPDSLQLVPFSLGPPSEAPKTSGQRRRADAPGFGCPAEANSEDGCTARTS